MNKHYLESAPRTPAALHPQVIPKKVQNMDILARTPKTLIYV